MAANCNGLSSQNLLWPDVSIVAVAPGYGPDHTLLIETDDCGKLELHRGHPASSNVHWARNDEANNSNEYSQRVNSSTRVALGYAGRSWGLQLAVCRFCSWAVRTHLQLLYRRAIGLLQLNQILFFFFLWTWKRRCRDVYIRGWGIELEYPPPPPPPTLPARKKSQLIWKSVSHNYYC